jgi:YVTN family beta-propeller protein
MDIRAMTYGGAVAGAFFALAAAVAMVAPGASEPRGPRPTTSNPADGPGDFVNWETPHVHPIALTPNGSRLLVCNTPDNRLEVFGFTTAGSLVPVASIPVGLDPVTVRPRNNNEVWVVNHISDSVSIVDLAARNVVATLRTLDEPRDVVFAGNPVRAYVSCSQARTVQVFDPANPLAAPVNIAIDAEEPRALAVSPDGLRVYAAVFESGNGSTILGGGAVAGAGNPIAFPPNVVTNPAGPYAGANPPPNAGTSFSPPIGPGAVNPPRVGLIVRKNAAGQWMDDNAHDWTGLVSGPQASLSGRVTGWDLPDHDVAIIDTANNNSVTYANRLMNICMDLAVNPISGEIAVVGTDATNEVRFEPNVNGRFIRVNIGIVNPANPANTAIKDLNPHLTYTTPTIPQAQRDRGLGDPRGIVWNSAGNRGYVSGMGSNNLVVIDAAGNRAGLGDSIPVGEGPTGLALDESRARLYVLNKFESSISVINTTTETELTRVPFFDPSPAAIKVGRKHLYNTHLTSGLGITSCGSCHVDARMDRLAWDLGDPQGNPKSLAGLNLGAGIPGLAPPLANPPFAPFHPMKGPMTTQTLQDIIGHEPHHWRGDRLGLEEFNPAFVGLLGDDVQLTPTQMQEFEDFLATITFPPNPFRNFNNSLPTNLPLPGHLTTGRFSPAGQPLPNGNAVAGLALYRDQVRRIDGGVFACVTCHTLPTGEGTDTTFSGGQFGPLPPGPNGEHHLQVVSVDGSTNVTVKTPQLRNLYRKTGFNALIPSNRAGFGFLHDGSVDSIERFVSEPAFNPVSDQEIANLTAFLLSFAGGDLPQGSPTAILEPPGPPSKDSHAAVGWQITVNTPTLPAPQAQLIGDMIAQAQAGKVGLVVKGRVAGKQRGFAYIPGTALFQSDAAAVTFAPLALLALAQPGGELTYTVVPKGSEIRIGIDRNRNGIYDFDEPGGTQCYTDCNGDGILNLADFGCFQTRFALGDPRADCNDDGLLNLADFGCFQTRFALGCP